MSENNKNQGVEDKEKQKPRGRGPGSGHAMGRPVEKAKDFKGTFNRLVGYLKPRRLRMIVVIMLAVLSTVFAIVSPKILAFATDKLFEGYAMKFVQKIPGAAIDFDYIGKILLMLIGLYLISSAFNYLMQYIMASVAQMTVYEMRQEVSEKLTKLPLKYYDSRTHGEVLSRITNDMDNISNTLQQSLTQLITSVVTILGSIVMMLTISPTLTLIAIITLPISVLVTKTVATKSQKYFKMQQKTLGELNGHVEEMYTGHMLIKAYGREETSIESFNKLNEELYDSGWKSQFVSGIIMPAMNFINNIGYVLVAVIGGIMVTNVFSFEVLGMVITFGGISVGSILAFIQYSRQFGQPIVQTANIANLIQSTIASAERVFEILDEDEEVKDKKEAIRLEEPTGHVAFEHVKFGYSDEKILMKDLSFNAEPGATIAIVGPTGAGKTTLVNLLMRFYEIQDGAIKVDGVDTRELKRGELRNIFGMVLQDTWLFKGTIRDNIAYACENPSEERIIEAAKAAHADHFIRTLPDGYDTVLNEEASNISQGQKQLLTIARAILANPSIMILDEATSSVDTRTEVYIQHAMKALIKNRTSFVIAHRLSTIRDADLILVMNDGDIIEQGTHEELLEMKSFYYDLYNSQFAGEKEAV